MVGVLGHRGGGGGEVCKTVKHRGMEGKSLPTHIFR